MSEKIKITYEQVIAGALTKFEKLDNVDISLLIEDLSETQFIQVDSYLKNTLYKLRKYVNTSEDGCILLKYNYALESIIANGYTLRETFLELAGETVQKYFDSINVEEFKSRKKKLLEEQKIMLLDNANVLLISDNEYDYEQLKEYGFKNIDYFKSIIRADKYFAKHPRELEKYHIILKGNQNVQKCCFDNQTELDNKIYEIRNKNHIIETPICEDWENFGDIKFVIWLNDFKNFRNWKVKAYTHFELFDRIVESAQINHVLDKTNSRMQNFGPIQDYINPNRLPLPTKKSELKILYLDRFYVSKETKEINDKLGLNATFKSDDNHSLGKYVKSHLGDYDIIIASETFSKALVNMNNESTEQCKDTGRNLTLLITYDDDTIHSINEDGIRDYQGFGDKVKINYVFGGELGKFLEKSSKEYNVVRENNNIAQSIIEEAIYLYNGVLEKTNNPTIQDLDVKNAEEYDKEYAVVVEKEEGRKKKALEPIHNFDNLHNLIIDYLRYRKQCLIRSNLEGLKIIESDIGIKIENIYNGRTLCAITIPKEHKKENLRIFSLQTVTKKGNLNEPEIIGLYTRKFEQLDGIPKRPNERQLNAITSVMHKVNYVIAPLNKAAWDKKRNNKQQGKQKTIGTGISK